MVSDKSASSDRSLFLSEMAELASIRRAPKTALILTSREMCSAATLRNFQSCPKTLATARRNYATSETLTTRISGATFPLSLTAIKHESRVIRSSNSLNYNRSSLKEDFLQNLRSSTAERSWSLRMSLSILRCSPASKN